MSTPKSDIPFIIFKKNKCPSKNGTLLLWSLFNILKLSLLPLLLSILYNYCHCLVPLPTPQSGTIYHKYHYYYHMVLFVVTSLLGTLHYVIIRHSQRYYNLVLFIIITARQSPLPSPPLDTLHYHCQHQHLTPFTTTLSTTIITTWHPLLSKHLFKTIYQTFFCFFTSNYFQIGSFVLFC